ncbi:MAG: hypothetical protein KAR45_15805 [Desulfobacteraceae bacterium]|nr:hypothetical protein [Desulfobacteraceae bacterium]
MIRKSEDLPEKKKYLTPGTRERYISVEKSGNLRSFINIMVRGFCFSRHSGKKGTALKKMSL